jgi:hypothetical protein
VGFFDLLIAAGTVAVGRGLGVLAHAELGRAALLGSEHNAVLVGGSKMGMIAEGLVAAEATSTPFVCLSLFQNHFNGLHIGNKRLFIFAHGIFLLLF